MRMTYLIRTCSMSADLDVGDLCLLLSFSYELVLKLCVIWIPFLQIAVTTFSRQLVGDIRNGAPSSAVLFWGCSSCSVLCNIRLFRCLDLLLLNSIVRKLLFILCAQKFLKSLKNTTCNVSSDEVIIVMLLFSVQTVSVAWVEGYFCELFYQKKQLEHKNNCIGKCSLFCMWFVWRLLYTYTQTLVHVRELQSLCCKCSVVMPVIWFIQLTV